jgi:sulfatase maturation enzyme AslB (radical SAM superfamily)
VQRCNLACTYCYAQGGVFGRDERAMSRETALRAVRCSRAQRGAMPSN